MEIKLDSDYSAFIDKSDPRRPTKVMDCDGDIVFSFPYIIEDEFILSTALMAYKEGHRKGKWQGAFEQRAEIQSVMNLVFSPIVDAIKDRL